MTQKRAGFGAYLVALFYAALPVAAAGGGLALAPLQAICGVGAAPLRHLLPSSRIAWAFFLFLLGFVAWAAITSLWSPYHSHMQALKTLGGYGCGLLFAAGAGATEPNRNLVRYVAAVSVAVLIALLCVEAVTNLSLNRIFQPAEEDLALLSRNPMRGGAVMVCLLWPCIATLVGGNFVERYGWKLMLLTGGYAALQFDASANAVAFGAGLAAYAIGYLAPRFALIALGLVLAIWQLAAPWVIQAIRIDPDVLHALPTSWEHRIEMWRYVVGHIGQHPVLGWGMDASRTLGRSIFIDGHDVNLLSLHPHNWGLHVWLETGAIGAGLAALTMAIGGFAASRALRFDRAAAAGACGAIAAYAVIANLSFGAWQEWWVATGFAVAAVVAASVRVTARDGENEDADERR